MAGSGCWCDGADDDPNFAVALGPELSDTMFEIAPNAAVECWGLRGDIRHLEGFTLGVWSEASDDGVVRCHVAAVKSRMRIVGWARGGGDGMVLCKGRAFEVIEGGGLRDVVGDPNGMMKGRRPTDFEFAAVECDDIGRGWGRDAEGFACEEDFASWGFFIIFIDRIGACPAEGIGEVANGVAC